MNDLSQGILTGLSGVAGGLSKRFDLQEAQRQKELQDFQKQQLLRNLLLSFQSYQPQQQTPEQKAAGEVGGVTAVPFGRPIGAPETVDAISRASADPAVLSQFLNMRSLSQPTYDIMNQEGGGYDIFKKVPGQVPERVGGKEGTPTDRAVTPTELLLRAGRGDPEAVAALKAQANQAGATTGAREAAQAPYDFKNAQITYPGPNGEPTLGILRVNPSTGQYEIAQTGQTLYQKPVGTGSGKEDRISALNSFEDLFKTYMKNLGQTTAGRVGGTIEKGKSMLGMSDPAKVVEDFKFGLSRFVGRRLFGEQRMTDQDVEQIIRSLPALTDTQTERAAKGKILWDIIQRAKADVGGAQPTQPQGPKYQIESID